MSKGTPLNKKLYLRAKAEAKRKFKVYPSAYANAWLSRRYKDMGGKYSSKKKSNSLSKGIKRYKKSQSKRRNRSNRTKASRSRYSRH